MKRYRLVLLVLISALALLSGCGKKDAKDYYKDGQAFMEKNDYKSAKECFEKAVKLDKNRAEYFISLGTAQVQVGDYKGAKKNFAYVIRDKKNQIVRENNKQAYRGLGIVYYCQAEYEKAAEQFDLALQIKDLPELTEDILQYCATSHERSQNTQKAIECYNRLVDEFGGKAQYYAQRGAFYASAGIVDKAIADYEQASKADKGNLEVMLGLYSLYQSQQDQASADAVLKKLLEAKTDTPERKYYHAVAQFYSGDSINALNELTALAKGGQAQAYYYIAQIYQKDKSYQKALKFYQLYLDNVPGGETAILNNQMGGCYTEQEEYKDALACYLKALSMNPGVAKQDIWKNVIVGMENTAEYDTAYDQVIEYLKEFPEDTDMQEELVFITSRLSRKKAKIVEADKKALQEGTTSSQEGAVTGSAVSE